MHEIDGAVLGRLELEEAVAAHTHAVGRGAARRRAGRSAPRAAAEKHEDRHDVHEAVDESPAAFGASIGGCGEEDHDVMWADEHAGREPRDVVEQCRAPAGQADPGRHHARHCDEP